MEVTLLSILVYLMHKLVFFLNESHPKLQGFHFPIEVVYGFFFVCSLLIIAILIQVNEKNIDNNYKTQKHKNLKLKDNLNKMTNDMNNLGDS